MIFMDLKGIKGRILAFFGLNKEKKELKAEAIKTTRFFLAFLAVFIILMLVFSFIPLILLEFITVLPVQFFLSLQGIQSSIELQEPLLLHLETRQTIIISYLCTGLIELTLIVSLILGSIGIPLKKRIIGAIISIPLTYFFNTIRIITTINAIISLEVQIVDLLHNILFRVTLFTVIVGIYFVWFSWATKNKSFK